MWSSWCGGQAGGMMGFGWIGWIFSLIFFILIIAGVVILIWWLIRQSQASTPKRDPLDVLKERYAKGEVGQEEFEKMKKDLQS